MSQSGQSDIDSILGDLEQEAEDAAIEKDITVDNSQKTPLTDEDTGEWAGLQEKEEPFSEKAQDPPSASQDPRGVPWRDFVPEYVHQFPVALTDRQEEQIANLNEALLDKERLKLAYIDKEIHDSYFKLWVEQSNGIFRSLVRLKKRLKRNKDTLEKKQDEKASSK